MVLARLIVEANKKDAPMIKIVSFKICPFVQRVTALLEAKNLPYDVSYISLKDKPQWFLDISPTGQVPVLITDEGMPLFESDAIVEYLDEISARLQEGLGPTERAIHRAWSYQASKHYLVQCSIMQSKDSMTLCERMKKLQAAFARVEKQLGEGPFFDGKTVGNVDIAWITLLHRASIVMDHSGFDMLEGYPKTKAWQRALLATGIPQKSVVDDFENVFSKFYLSENTWLGRGAKIDEGDTPVTAAGGCCG